MSQKDHYLSPGTGKIWGGGSNGFGGGGEGGSFIADRV